MNNKLKSENNPPISSPEFKGNVNLDTYTKPKDSEILYYTPILGDAISWVDVLRDVKDQNYTNAALGVGLAFVPNILEKTVLKPVIRRLNKTIKRDIKSKSLNNSELKRSAEDAVKEGVEKTVRGFTGLDNLDNIVMDGSPTLAEDVLNRYKKLGLDFTEHLPKFKDESLHVYVRDNTIPQSTVKSKLLDRGHSQKKDLGFEIYSNSTHISNPNMSGFSVYDDLGNQYISIDLNDFDGRKTSSELSGVASHETLHALQNILNKDLDKSIVLKDGLVKRGIYNSLKPSGWGKSLSELQANIWKFRNRHNIYGRDLTDFEAELFLKEFGDVHFKNGCPANIKKELVKIIPVIGGYTIFDQTLTNDHNE